MTQYCPGPRQSAGAEGADADRQRAKRQRATNNDQHHPPKPADADADLADGTFFFILHFCFCLHSASGPGRSAESSPGRRGTFSSTHPYPMTSRCAGSIRARHGRQRCLCSLHRERKGASRAFCCMRCVLHLHPHPDTYPRPQDGIPLSSPANHRQQKLHPGVGSSKSCMARMQPTEQLSQHPCP
ncbi:hypothetical protein BCR34DRAFT_299438 [Clohesyomyces aquaticus]|uniref:Uncharacterized protein n=1 Tax=Clohesyomyces aquaticus TaxID=1231657 RepID=A0A1Y1ZQ63_9PLEO|nr:hypothetical protein BCR34DRAFT_299438 [Clohesyomyces aquaticus]